MTQAELTAWINAQPMVITDSGEVTHLCCDEGTVEAIPGFLIFDCPHHLRVVFRSGAVFLAERRGARQ